MEDNIQVKGGESMMFDASLAIKITKEGTEIINDFQEQLKAKTIEDIAWQVFLNKSRLSFIRELTPEEKKMILDVEGNEYYREQAQKIYEKKQLSLLNKKYPVINVPSSGKHSWSGGAYTLCFVYSKFNGNFVLKGYYDEVKEYLKKNYTHYFYNMSLWHHGFSRDIWYFWKKDIGIFEASVKERMKGKKTQIRPYSDCSYGNKEMSAEEIKSKTLYFKRLPKRWIPEFDKL
jgi:hypothetical protein